MPITSIWNEDEQIELEKHKAEEESIARFMRIVHRYTGITGLIAEILRELIDKITVYQAENIDGKRKQTIEIIYKCVKAIPFPATTEKAV